MELNYDIDVQASLDEIRQTITIEGQAIDTSVNENNWQVPSEDIDYFVSTLKNAQLRINHGTNVEDVKGVVKTVKRVGDMVLFSAEVSGDPILLTQIEKKYLNMVSPKVISDKTRNENLGMVHLCSGAYEVVHKPQCMELSIVAVGAYKNNIFRPKGFAAAMNEAQLRGLIASKCECLDKAKCPCGISQMKSKVQSDLHGLNQVKKIGEKTKLTDKEPPVPPVEETEEEKAAKAKTVKAGTELTYQQFEDQLTKNTAQVMEACKAAIAEGFKPLEAKIDEKVKSAVAALIPKIAVKPTGKGVIAAPDDAQRLNNMFARKADLHKAGLELKAAAHKMAGLTADITHEEEEEA
jgi:hypothetical protein